ncbi:MAG: TraR/DksA family transcriptional regulator [bacterium]
MKKSLQTTKKANSRWQTVAKIETSLNQQKNESVARSSASELSLAQLKQLKLKLTEIREELTRSVELKTQSVINHANVLENTMQGDDAEVAEKQRLSNANLQELDFLKSRLQLIDRALLKMKEGCYGICEETEEPIGFERLHVVPWARFSIKVQEKREIRSRDFGRIQRAE